MSTSVTSVPLRSPTTMLSAPPSARKSMRSTSFRSIVTLATSRKNRTRPPFAEISMFSLMFAPKNSMRVRAVLAFDGIVAVAGVPLEHVVAGTEQREVVAAVADTKSSPSPPSNTSAPWLPRIVSSPAPPSIVSLIMPAGSVAAVIAVVAATAVDDQRVVRVLRVRDVDQRRKADDRDRGARAEHVDRSSLPLVPLTITVSAWPSPGRAADRAGEVDVDRRDVRPAEVVDRDDVGAAQRIDVDGLDVVEIHDDVADVAGEAHPLAVRGDVECSRRRRCR